MHDPFRADGRSRMADSVQHRPSVHDSFPRGRAFTIDRFRAISGFLRTGVRCADLTRTGE
ncbi:hypothetical protein GCM10023107_05450 [Actinoplanes octamycinicus]|nr:hypothetical protein Aoc01nite_07050 [Actinoplanes octamycinicus]